MPLAITPCAPQPVIELVRSKPINAETAAIHLRKFLEDEEVFREKGLAGAPSLACAGFMQVVGNQTPEILERLEYDWVAHPDISLLDCFCEVDGMVEVHLNPCFLGPRLGQGLRKAAGDIILKYQRVLNCIPLTMQDLRPAGSRHGAVVGDGPYVHFLASFRCVGFAPQRQGWILGRIATEQHSGKGMNVNILKLLNTYVRRDSLPSELSYNAEQKAWCNGEVQLNDRHVVLLKVSELQVEAATIGEMGIGLQGYIESIAHIRKQRRTPSAAKSSNAAPTAEPSPAKRRKETSAASTAEPSPGKRRKETPATSTAEPSPGKRRKETSAASAAPEEPSQSKRRKEDSSTTPNGKKSRKE